MWRQRTICLNCTRVLRNASSSPWLQLSCSSYSELSNTKSKATPLQERRMIDRFRLHVKGGDGGSGCHSVRRSRQDRFGKPDGANGGKGGDVILQCTSSVWDFRGLQHHVNGSRGGPGSSKNKIGSRGEDKVVRVPVGTVIHLVEGEIPSVIDQQSSSSEYSDPWEIPGALSSDKCESDHDHKSSSMRSMKVEETAATRIVPSSRQRRQGFRMHKESPSGTSRSGQMSSITCYSQPTTSCYQSSPLEEVLLNDDDVDDDDDYDDDNDGDYDGSMEMDHDMSEVDQEKEEEIQYNVAELTEEGQQVVVAHGGEGGLGSVSSGRSSRKTSSMMKNDLSGLDEEDYPTLSAGVPGSEAVLILELKTIADVGLVGMPNAGKSTLLGAISRAKPAVGHYAFTTLRPNIGKVNYDDISISVADIPGLIKGAHSNRGLGHAFLRHIERTKVLAYVVDLAAALDGRKGIPPWEQLRDLVLELEYYREGLTTRPSLIVANKIDEAGAEDVCKELQRRVKGVPIFPVCAILEEGVGELKAGLRLLVDGTETSTLGLDSILAD